MFISVEQLHNSVGVDETIARFFVDRKLPVNNAFWRNKLLYIARGNGYVSIPVYYDILFRLGIPRELLLSETHVQLMEQIMHYAIMVEFQEISFDQQLNEIKSLLSNRVKDEKFYNDLLNYLNQPVLKPLKKFGMTIPALNRADVFLFILCDISLSKQQTDLAVKYWYALHTSYLLMDDMYDYKTDKHDKEENSIIELGDGEPGFEKAFEILKKNATTLHAINPTLANYFEASLEGLYNLIP